MTLPDGEYDFEIVSWRVHGDDGDYNIKAEFGLQCLKGAYTGNEVRDVISLGTTKGPFILQQKLKAMGHKGEINYETKFLQGVGQAILGRQVRVQLTSKFTVNGNPYQYFYYTGLIHAEDKPSSARINSPKVAETPNTGIDLDADARFALRLLEQPPIHLE